MASMARKHDATVLFLLIQARFYATKTTPTCMQTERERLAKKSCLSFGQRLRRMQKHAIGGDAGRNAHILLPHGHKTNNIFNIKFPCPPETDKVSR
jgi:hypothetical protein